MSDADTLIPVRPELTPAVSPNAATLAASKAFGDRLSTSAPPLALALTAYVEAIVRALRDGDIAAVIVGMQSVEATAEALLNTMNGWGPVENMIRALDPNYFAALDPARREFLVLRQVRELQPMSSDQLHVADAMHRKLCRHTESTCGTHEAIARVLAQRGYIRG